METIRQAVIGTEWRAHWSRLVGGDGGRGTEEEKDSGESESRPRTGEGQQARRAGAAHLQQLCRTVLDHCLQDASDDSLGNGDEPLPTHCAAADEAIKAQAHRLALCSSWLAASRSRAAIAAFGLLVVTSGSGSSEEATGLRLGAHGAARPRDEPRFGSTAMEATKIAQCLYESKHFLAAGWVLVSALRRTRD